MSVKKELDFRDMLIEMLRHRNQRTKLHRRRKITFSTASISTSAVLELL
jgi:hypothetical protein